MYIYFKFSHSLKNKPIIAIETSVVWNKFEFHTGGSDASGGTFAAYQISSNNGGPGGYFGDQMRPKFKGTFRFSLWDGDRKVRVNGKSEIKKSSKLAWPLNMDRCKRNCQDCNMPHQKHLKKARYSTGTQCEIEYPKYTGGNGYTIKLMRIKEKMTINTADYGGMPKSHKMGLGENDREVTGSSWKMIAINFDTKKEYEVGEILLEGATSLVRLNSFDEMLYCKRRCVDRSIYHKDTRYGPKITYEDGTMETPISVKGRTARKSESCKVYRISGSKNSSSIVFESGPGTKNAWQENGKTLKIW